ncbi:ATP-binding cassette, subfamily B [Atopostipes suicloacalis DSM 15692]|uniref:ATP-binding cassette, subfamily B n=1 Tax=Atopostipes suicloacalis DSM 15692 TaxID=1121025 RepID=A0A1M4VX34_9LACT|nr:ABC transporter ATP-binding protein [Atopostipes suicloacalis]SHE73526.1 ATP-binding cassette, subfamily B [Atopostipes suicloacalis DSM 15692]
MFEVMLKLKDFFNKNKKDYIRSFITMIASNLFSVFIPYLIGQLIDYIVQDELTYRLLIKVISAFLFSLIAAYIFEFIWSYYLFTGAAKLQRSMRDNLMAHFLNMRSIFFEKFRVGDLMARSTQDVRAIADTAGYGMMVLMNATLFLTTIVGMMGFSVSWRLTIFSLFPLIILAYTFDKLGNELEKRFSIAQESFSSLNNDVLEVVDGIRVIRAYVKEEDYLDKFRKQTESMLVKNNRVADINAMFMPFVKIITSICTVISFGYGTFLVYEGTLSVGNIVAFQMYLGMIIWPIISIGELTNVLRQGSAAMIRVEDVLNTTDEMEENGFKDIEDSNDIVMQNLNFQYPTSQEMNLSQINIEIPKGKTMGIVGKTGAGKTTLLRQFLRQYPLGDGDFFYGDDGVLDYQRNQIQHLIGYVPQDHILFSRSVRDNIAFGKGQASDQEILESIKIAAFDEDLLQMNKGLDTMIGEKGVSISGGQKQRISLARALIKNPEILILDDALSAVDAKTEQRIISNIQQVRTNKTTLISTHRLSAVKEADEIIVLEEGQIVEHGNHEELLALQGWYYKQYLRQELKEGDA